MERKTGRQSGLLAVLLVVLAGVLWWNLSGDTPHQAVTKARSVAAQRGASGRAPADAVEDVRLAALADARPEPGAIERDPFRFEPKAPPPPPPGPRAQARGARPEMEGVIAGPPPPVPIPLKFIGIVQEPAQHRTLAALSDGRFTYYGREGDIIEGRYRIVKIGLESIELAHVDGRGQQTIRLSGS